MNIYLTGSHGTGKTTVANLIAEQSDFGTLPSVSRTSPYRQGTEEHQRYVMDQVVRRTKVHDQTIQDRTPLDVFAYTLLFEHSSEYNAQKMQVDRFLRVAEHSGDPIFYFPIYFPLASDGVRPGKWEQIVVDSLIRASLKTSGIEYHTIPDGTPEERVDFVLERIPHASL